MEKKGTQKVSPFFVRPPVPGVCRPTSKNGPEQKYGFTRCAVINDHGAVKGSNAPR
jgi:hypothetical protein